MKKQIVLFVATGILFLFFQSFRPDASSESVIPDEITSIMKTSCYDCHYTGSSSEKALNALNFEKWDDFRLTKQIGLLGDIGEVVEEKKMPPGKYLENKPEAALSDALIKQLADWTRQESEKLMQAD